MIRAEYRFSLPVSPAEAFAVLADPSRDAEWQANCLSTTLLDPGPAPGCRYQISFRMLGRTLNFTSEITDFEPGVRSGYTVLDGPFRYTGGYTYAGRTGETDVHWVFDVDPGAFFGILPVTLMRKILVSQVEKDTRTLTALLVDQCQSRGVR